MREGAVRVEVVAALVSSKETNVYSIGSGCDVKEENHSAEAFLGERLVKEASNDDIKSEVLNPIVSPKGNASSCQDITSQSTRVRCGEATSQWSGDLSQAETVSDEGETSCENVLTGSNPGQLHVGQEIAGRASTAGIRKITFKFSKRKEDYDNQAVSQVRVSDTDSSQSYSEWDDSDMRGFKSSDRCNQISHIESMMSINDIPSNYPSNVKKLLLTGILDGARVKYVSRAQKRELDGFIHMSGYLCGCSLCNFSNVLSAYEFERHAGAKTKHPNNHIFLENGKPVYNIIQELKTAPLCLLDEVIKKVAGTAINEELFQVWKASLRQTNATYNTNKRRCSHLLVSQSSNSLEESFWPTSTPLGYHRPVLENNMDSCERQHSTLKRPTSNDCSSVVKQKKTSDHCSKRSHRDNDLHRQLFMSNGLPDGAELAYYAKGQKLLAGYKQRNGILCSCCYMEVSPSQFEAHAGMAARRQPYRNIYTSNGLSSLHDIALSLLSGQNIITGIIDDMCMNCGNGGDLVFCETCPRAFHQACLDSPDISNGGWHCPECSQYVNEGNHSRSIVIRSTRVIKAPQYEVGGCAVCRSHDFTPVIFDDHTVILCDQCEKEFHVGCLRNSGICDLKEIPTNQWFCCDECKRIHAALETVVSSGVRVILGSQINIIVSKHADKGGFIDGGANFRLHILKGSSHRPEDLSLLSATTAIFRECFDPIVAAAGCDLIPVMVHGRNISGQEFGGMYCVLLTVNAVVVSAGLLRIFGRDIAELPLVATSREHQGKGYFQALFACIENLLCSLTVENLVLPAAGEAESIWTRRFGFRKISEQRMLEYSKYQLTIFQGTSMLEKEVQRTCQEPALADEV